MARAVPREPVTSCSMARTFQTGWSLSTDQSAARIGAAMAIGSPAVRNTTQAKIRASCSWVV